MAAARAGTKDQEPFRCSPGGEGRTNNQIAETLFITGKTASVHVSNILAKLDAANRGEAAAPAHRAGFVRTG